MSYKKVFYSILTIFSVSIVAKALGFLRETFLANYFGTSLEIDLYYLVYGIFFALSGIIGSSIGIAYIPEHFKNKSYSNWKEKSYEMFLFTGIISFFIVLITFLFADDFGKMLNSNGTINSLEKIVYYIKINSLAFFFQTLTFFLVAVLNAEKKFGRGELIGTAYSLTVIFSLFFLYERLGIQAIIYSFLISSVCTFIILYLYIYGVRYYLPKVSIKYYILITSATLIGTSTIYIGQIYDRIIASRLVEGSQSALSYSGNIHSLVNVFFIVSIVNVIYSELNSYDKESLEFKTNVSRLVSFSFSLFSIILIPLSLFLYLYSSEVVSIIFKRGNFGDYSVSLTSDVFQMYVIGSFFFALRDLGNKLFYTFDNRKIPIYLGIVFLFINFALCYILALFMGVKGISLAVTITSLFYMIYVLFLLWKKYSIYIKRRNLYDFFKIIFFCLIVYILFYCFPNWLEFGTSKTDKIFSLILSGVIYVVSYLIYCYIINISLIRNNVFKLFKK
ncbi:hypothetical protein GJV76_10545 [Myroides sp. BIT-d1]|uniref:Uncharacterized protein n=1 Tax=Myroides albus TaxID=2562892 RepID=A0A6I3LIZ5_9FLAO|nr:lipid II flippase MurJ [Myroides albus]MTG98558.1 hypothetical protein [Myroides albus]